MSNKNETLGLYQEQLQTYVGFTSFMTVVSVFFTGLLITQFATFDIFIKVPIAFLILSIFGFLYSTMIYSNAAEEISQKRLDKAKRHILWGDILSEYIGVYLLILAIPLVINIVTSDTFLRTVTIVSSLGGFSIYQFSHLSVMERHFKRHYDKFTLLIILFSLLLFFLQLYRFYFVELSGLFIVFIFIISYLASKKR